MSSEIENNLRKDLSREILGSEPALWVRLARPGPLIGKSGRIAADGQCSRGSGTCVDSMQADRRVAVCHLRKCRNGHVRLQVPDSRNELERAARRAPRLNHGEPRPEDPRNRDDAIRLNRR